MRISQNYHILFTVLVIFLFIKQVRNKVISPQENTKDSIVSSESVPWDGHQYYFSYLTKFGLFRRENGQLQTNANGNQFINIMGQYNLPTSDGFLELYYTANDEGFNILDMKKVKDYGQGNIDKNIIVAPVSALLNPQLTALLLNG